MEAVILAGGFGKRLKGIVENIPKPMALINNKPFLDYLLSYLLNHGVRKVIFSVFYKYEILKNRYGLSFDKIKIDYSIDKQALGTGGAIKNALSKTSMENIIIINGDTLFNIDLNKFYKEHIKNQYDISLSLKPMQSFDRYGIVKVGRNKEVLSLQEKEFCKKGNIDGGVYLIKNDIFKKIRNKKVFSFNEFLTQNLDNLKVGGMIFDNFFIDIGTPEDYIKSQKILRGKLW